MRTPLRHIVAVPKDVRLEYEGSLDVFYRLLSQDCTFLFKIMQNDFRSEL
jgi:hypothetical protein